MSRQSCSRDVFCLASNACRSCLTQQLYEQLRPIILFGETAGERAKETGIFRWEQRELGLPIYVFVFSGCASFFLITFSASVTLREVGCNGRRLSLCARAIGAMV